MSAPKSVTLEMTPELEIVVGDWEELVNLMRHYGRTTNSALLPLVANQIEAQLPKPKPAEPKGLGAVVKDRKGRSWLRVVGPGFDRPWARVGVNPHYGFAAQDGTETSYADIDVVEVLSEGVPL